MISLLPASVAAFLQGSLVHAGLFAGGALLVSLPILIHLLNRRRFRTLDWAAMDLLLEAERRNRRRIQLEHFLLLLLRCLAVLLLALLVARPFLPSQWAGQLLDSPRFERIVVLDDSLSLQARGETGRTAFAAARQACGEFLRNLATNASDDSCTLLLTSRPERKVFQQREVNAHSLEEILAELEGLAAADTPSNLAETFSELTRYLEGGTSNINRVVYLATDFRQEDWAPESASSEKPSLAHLLGELAGKCQQVFLIDVGSENTANLAVLEIRPRDDRLIADVETQFDVTVANTGSQRVREVSVKLAAGASAPQTATLESLAPGDSAVATFTQVFSLGDFETSPERHFEKPVPLVAEVQAEGAADVLPGDNQRRFAARVAPGVPVLLVDGDPASTPAQAETYFLRHALNAPGAVRSGVLADVVTEVEFESVVLSKYRVIALCNVGRPGAAVGSGEKPAIGASPRLLELEAWVRGGGSLVLFPGDQVDESYYNSQLYNEGRGLLPAQMSGLSGDETEEQWRHLEVAEATHPSWRIMAGNENPFASEVKVFRWWRMKPHEPWLQSGEANVPVHLNDDVRSPGWIERRLGQGNVALAAFPADADWHNWPDSPSYLVACQSLIASLCRGDAMLAQVATPQAIEATVDLGEFRAAAELLLPEGTVAPLQAAPRAGENGSPGGAALPAVPTGEQAVWRVVSAPTLRQGFYTLKLARHEGESRQLLFAANPPASESRLARIERAELKQQLGNAPVGILDEAGWAQVEAQAAYHEIWQPLVFVLAGVLLLEQLLGWWFGRYR